MTPAHLTLAAVAALAAAGAVRRRGSANKITPFQKRLLFFWKTYPPERAAMATGVVMNLLSGRADAHKHLPYGESSGLNRLRQDMAQIASEANAPDPVQYFKTWATDQLRLGEWYSSSPRNFSLDVDPPVGWEKFIPWIGKEVNRLLKKPGLLHQVTASMLGYRGQRWRATLTLDGVRALIAHNQGNPRSWEEDTSGVRELVYAGKPVGRYLPNLGFDHWSQSHRSDMPLVPREVLGLLHISRLVKALPRIRDWWSSGEAGNIMSLTYEQAAWAARKWHREIERAEPGGADAIRASTRGTPVAQLSDGWVIERLAPHDLMPQTLAMKHCAGRTDTYRRGIERGTMEVLSVRDDQGRSRFTLEVRNAGTLYSQIPQLKQFKGTGNRIPGLTKAKTDKLGDISVEEMRGKIERARKPFVSETDLKRAKEVFLALPAIYGAPVEDTSPDLVVLYATGTLPPPATRRETRR